ncbi:hypothetical protein MX572_23000 (plasmid) [Rhodococcus pyridinivorans]|uniref:terminase small subunit n=1 Tax=Rhodococcus pyridinivorans TaxID=103816 RepID=UPI0020C68B08|nr:hypothetical protein [Rhodococcus pyridinivorans]UTM39668.1 hypothetical protein MX572_23055 [Rhodococcus pyridinivorans]UTM39680.1 hypothetical protein MX572_23000 [Rhodococcus pyridinivorans]
MADESLQASVARSIAAAQSSGMVTDADQAAVDLALRYALVIEQAVEEGGDRATAALHLGPHLNNTLAALGCTPASRAKLAPVRRRPITKLEARRQGRTDSKPTGER